MIEGTEKHDSVKYRSQMCSTFRGCKRGDVCDPVITMHENLVELCVMVKVNNVVEFFMANVTAMSHTNYVYIRHKYINEYIEDGVVEIVFVKYVEMTATFSQRILVESYMGSIQKMICEKPE